MENPRFPMAIQLHAEQKRLNDLFSGSNTFVIPPYQRPYSWGLAECSQLYNDLLAPFNRSKNGTKTDYFLGNIVLAVAANEPSRMRVVDGQQRLTTLWVMFKTLSLFLPGIASLRTALCTQEWNGENGGTRITAESELHRNRQQLDTLLDWQEEDFGQAVEKYAPLLASRFPELADEEEGGQAFPAEEDTPGGEDGDAAGEEYDEAEEAAYWEAEEGLYGGVPDYAGYQPIEGAAAFFYLAFRHFRDEWGEQVLTNFARYLLTEVYLLPIQMYASSAYVAENKALAIFETINNRGLDLSDADIFKARLYGKARLGTEREGFLREWEGLEDLCAQIDADIDLLFSHYRQLVLAQCPQEDRDRTLREFFDGANGEIERHGYRDIMDSLMRIARLLRQVRLLSVAPTRQGALVNVICRLDEEYSELVVVAYLYCHGEDEGFDRFLERAVRYLYKKMALVDRDVIATLLAQVMSGKPVDECWLTADWLGKARRWDAAELGLLAAALETCTGIGECTPQWIAVREPAAGQGIMPIWRYAASYDIGGLLLLPKRFDIDSEAGKAYLALLDKTDPEAADFLRCPDRPISSNDRLNRSARKIETLKGFLLAPDTKKMTDPSCNDSK